VKTAAASAAASSGSKAQAAATMRMQAMAPRDGPSLPARPGTLHQHERGERNLAKGGQRQRRIEKISRPTRPPARLQGLPILWDSAAVARASAPASQRTRGQGRPRH
jgi:hypothetical protein